MKLSAPVLPLLAALLMPWSAPAAGQGAAPPPKITATTELVLVPTIVRDKAGKHISGLSKQDFVVLQDGRPQKLAVFEEVRTARQRVQPVAVPRGEFTTQLLQAATPTRLTVVVIDLANTPFSYRERLNKELIKFLTAAASVEEPIALVAVTERGIEIIHDFTTDPKILLAALEQRKPGKQMPSGEGGAGGLKDPGEMIAGAGGKEGSEHYDEIVAHTIAAVSTMTAQQAHLAEYTDRMQRLSSLETLQQIAQAIAGLPGRKSLVWASAGFPFANLIASSALPARYIGTTTSGAAGAQPVGAALGMQERTWQVLNAANIAVYPLDARGMTNVQFDVMGAENKYGPETADNDAALNRKEDIIAGFENIARATGGKAFYNRTNLAECFREAAEDGGEYYMLGYYVDRSKTKPGWRRLAVKVEAKGAHVRARNTYLLSDVTPEAVRLDDIRLALSSPWLYTGLDFRGRWLPPVPQEDGKAKVEFELTIPASAIGANSDDFEEFNLDVAALARKANGDEAAQQFRKIATKVTAEQREQIRSGGLVYHGTLDLPAGVYLARIVVRDNQTGRIGAVSSMVTVP